MCRGSGKLWVVETSEKGGNIPARSVEGGEAEEMSSITTAGCVDKDGGLPTIAGVLEEENEASKAVDFSAIFDRSPANERRWKGRANASATEEGEAGEEKEVILEVALGERERVRS